MQEFGVKAVAKFAGVSVRTLHHYDRIGLLKPAARTEAGYRYYGEAELLRLQQILFYKELDVPLKEIQELLDEPGFDMVEALQRHKSALINRQQRLNKLLQTIDNTIDHLKKENFMTDPEMLYEGMPKEEAQALRKEAIEEYGAEEVERSEKAMMQLGKNGFQQLQAEFEALNRDLFALREQDPASPRVQQLTELHYQIIRKFWGTTQLEDKQAEAYTGLGDLYVSDERFALIDGQYHPEFARFLQKAMKQFAESRLQ
ncbi:MAG: MerR family transcriptional regulator [Bacteroidota bacterium]